MQPARIGLTGGIGSGKSTVAGIWRAQGLRVIDLDAHSRLVLDRPGPGVEEAVARFGEQIRKPQGTIDRAALAQIVFQDSAARADLEGIVLGRVEEAVAAEEREAAAAGERLVVHDSPLLLEKEQDRAGRYAAVVAVVAGAEARIERVMRDRGKSREYVTSIIAAQVSDLQRIHRADYLVLNSGSLTQVEARALRALEKARARAEALAAMGGAQMPGLRQPG